jgi:hypothetical protein
VQLRRFRGRQSGGKARNRRVSREAVQALFDLEPSGEAIISPSRTPLDSDLFTSICCSTMAPSDKDSIDTYGDEEQLVSLAVHEPLRCRGRPAMRERESRSAS